MKLVGMVSSYLEGWLVQEAVRSLLEAVDHVYVCEGPAGDPITAEVPPTDLGELARDPAVSVWEGRWRTDARKRTTMIERARGDHARSRHEPPGAPTRPLWGLWLDGDEVLFHGRFLRDWLQVLAWKEELDQVEPYLGRPIRIVELDGSVGWTRGKVVRLDLIRRYEVSAALFVNEHGVVQGAGNHPDSYLDWRIPREPYFASGQIVIPPPIPGEPFILHRSALRHPVRAGNRLHRQEAEEYAKRKQPA